MTTKTVVIETVTPVHIGNGETYFSWEICEIDGNHYRVNVVKLLEEYLRENPGKRLTQINRETVSSILRSIPTENMLKHVLYRLDEVNANIHRERRIYEHIKTVADNKLVPYIPGSTVKGMLRTFKIMQILESNPKLADLILDEYRRKRFKGTTFLESDITDDSRVRSDKNLSKIRKGLKTFSKYTVVRDFLPKEFKLKVEEIKIITRSGRSIPVMCEVVEGRFEGEIISEKEDIAELVEFGKSILENKIKIGKYAGIKYHTIAPVLWKMGKNIPKKPVTKKVIGNKEVGIVNLLL